MSLAKANRIRILAVAGDTRLAQIPDVPTFKEVGYPSFTAYNWAAASTSAKTPPVTVAKLSDWFQAIGRADETQAFFARNGNESGQIGGAELRRFQVAEIQRWKDIAALIHLQRE